MERYNFSVVIEPDGDKWFVCVSEFEQMGVATWGESREEAARKLIEVAIMTFQDVANDGPSIVNILRGANGVGA